MKYVPFAMLAFVVVFSFSGFSDNVAEGNDAYQSKKNVTFQLIQTFGADTSPKEAMLSSVLTVATDKWNNLYVLDRGALLSFKPDGSLRWKVNKPGSGPGDLYHANGMAVDGEKYLYLENIGGTRIDRFDLNGKFIKTFNLSEAHFANLQIKGFVKPDLLITTSYAFGKIAEDIVILRIGDKLELKNRFLVDETDDNKIPGALSVALGVVVSGDKIAVGNCYKYKLNIFDLNGKIVKTLKKKFNLLPRPYVINNGIGVFGGVSAPYKISKKYYICRVTWPADAEIFNKVIRKEAVQVYKHTLDIFDEEGKLVISEVTDGNPKYAIGSLQYTDDEGYLYASKSSPYPQICKYKVIIEDKK